MFFRAVVTLTFLGLIHSLTTPFPFTDFFPEELEWDCTDDHAPHSTDKRKFLQSPNGFGNESAITVSQCPHKFMEFSQERGVCRCLFTKQLRELLEKECQARSPPNGTAPPQIYETLVPSLDRNTVDDLYVPQTCYDLLPKRVVDFFLENNVNPLFFNETTCRCEWTEESKEVKGRPIARGRKCETLVDQTFSDVDVKSDHVGNWIEVFPFEYQENVTLKEGGTVFGDGLITTIQRRLTGTDFRELTIMARFRAEAGSTDQLIFTNMCVDPPTADSTDETPTGLVELTYNPNSRQFSLQFFGIQKATCTPPNLPGGFVEHTLEVIYKHGVVRLVVNGFECDIGVLNPVTENGKSRLVFDKDCPMQIGGVVKTDVEQLDFGAPLDRVDGFQGIFKNFAVLRNCPTLPKEIKDRMAETTSQ